MGEDELHRVDTAVILAVEEVLATRHMHAFGAESAHEFRHHLPQNVDAHHAQVAAPVLERRAQGRLHERIEDHAGVATDRGESAFEPVARAHQRPAVLDGLHGVELRERGARHGARRLPGRVRYEVEMTDRHAATITAGGAAG